MPTQRMRRVNELLKREIADLLERVDFSMEDCLVSVSEVDTSPDLRHAKVHISVLGGDDTMKLNIMRFLRRNRARLQKKMAHDIALKYTPVLEFSSDHRIESGDRVLALIAELNKEEE
jgi:ribosome-binding factor A